MDIKNKITLKDIANIVGISTNSVSKALKNNESISLKTRIRVKEVANELGYIPNLQALALKNGRTNVIAVIYDNLNNPYYSLMLEEINKQLVKTNLEMMVFVDRHSIGYLSNKIVKKVISYNVRGILSFLEPTLDASKIINEYNVPFVLIGRNGKKSNVNSIYSDDYKGGELAARILLEKGCKNFLYYTIHEDLDIDKERMNGFKDYLLKHNVLINNIKLESIHTDSSFNQDKLLDKFKDNSKTNIDGIFCFNDLLAFEIIQLLYENNLLTNNINVIGYDNIQTSLPYPIRVSSIAPNYKEVIKISLSSLLNLNINKDKIINLKMPVYFFKGTTT